MADESPNDPTPEEFEGWIRPYEAVELLKNQWDWSTSRKAILTRLQSGLIVGAARKVTWKYGSKEKTADYVIVLKSLWRPDSQSQNLGDWWDTGDIVMTLPGRGYEINVNSLVSYFDVRFKPPGIEAILRVPRSITFGDTPSVAEERQPVSRADLQKWHEVFKAVHPDAAEALAWRSAAAMFPDKQVPRQWVRDLRGPQKRGKPPTRR